MELTYTTMVEVGWDCPNRGHTQESPVVLVGAPLLNGLNTT
jgi:hypothetical protein